MNTRNRFAAVDQADYEDFDDLLDQSSLGSPVAKENLAQTPNEVHQLVQSHFRSRGSTCRRGEVDDFVLFIVRWYSLTHGAELPARDSTTFTDNNRFMDYWHVCPAEPERRPAPEPPSHGWADRIMLLLWSNSESHREFLEFYPELAEFVDYAGELVDKWAYPGFATAGQATDKSWSVVQPLGRGQTRRLAGELPTRTVHRGVTDERADSLRRSANEYADPRWLTHLPIDGAGKSWWCFKGWSITGGLSRQVQLLLTFVEDADMVPRFMQAMYDRQVFLHLRQDVARDMVELCFARKEPLPLAIRAACATAVTATNLSDELAKDLAKLSSAPPSTPWPTGSLRHRVNFGPVPSSTNDPTDVSPVNDVAYGVGAGKADAYSTALSRSISRCFELCSRDSTGLLDRSLVVLKGCLGGRTSVALRLLHELDERPDGQLLVNWDNATCSALVNPREVLNWFLDEIDQEIVSTVAEFLRTLATAQGNSALRQVADLPTLLYLDGRGSSRDLRDNLFSQSATRWLAEFPLIGSGSDCATTTRLLNRITTSPIGRPGRRWRAANALAQLGALDWQHVNALSALTADPACGLPPRTEAAQILAEPESSRCHGSLALLGALAGTAYPLRCGQDHLAMDEPATSKPVAPYTLLKTVCQAPVYQGMPHGGVFISYRAEDQPLAAGAIHDALARRFGADRVFRDCASMRAGQNSPTAIRAALESATVLVAIVSPRWLTLTEPRTSNRLIDRTHDWVRLEIASALRRRIPIIPVILKETPEDAARLNPAEFPDEIRQFAKLQAFEFSQRQFGEDLDRLVDRLLQLEPALAVRRPKVITIPGAEDDPPDAFSALVEAFLDVPHISDEGNRRLLLKLIRPEIAAAVQSVTTSRR